ALHVDRDLPREVTARDGGGHVGDVTHLGREVAGHEVDGVGEVLPRSADAGYVRLPPEPSLGAHLPGDSRHFRGEGAELVDPGLDPLSPLGRFAVHVDRDLPREVAARDRCGDVGDVADLNGQIAAHRVDGVGEVLPDTGDAG